MYERNMSSYFFENLNVFQIQSNGLIIINNLRILQLTNLSAKNYKKIQAP